jgi:S1-C subfamily serine protease
MNRSLLLFVLLTALFSMIGRLSAVDVTNPDGSLPEHDWLVDRVQTRVVKIFGAGGARGLESYQSGIWIGNDGYILTSWSTVLDASKLRVIAFDGRKFDSLVVAFDPANELALLKVEQPGIEGFDLESGGQCRAGQRVFAISNLFKIATGDEYCSVQKGVVMTVSPLTQRKGMTKTLTQGKVYVLDCMTNNPGASGGALIDLKGQLVGVLGKEIRDVDAGIWINYALPLDIVKASVQRMQSGSTEVQQDIKIVEKPHRIGELGLTLIPDVLPKTPVFVDEVRRGSIAERSGLRSNDLVLLVNNQRVDSRKIFEKLLASINRADSFELLVQREQELIRIIVRP